MKKKLPYKEINDANYLLDLMHEDVFGHRVTMVTAKDTNKLKNKLYQPVNDKEKEDYVAIVEPIMNRKSYISKQRDSNLDSFIDIDTRISQSDFEEPEYQDDDLDYLLGGMDDIIGEE
jgi:hypothetical protein